MTKLGGYSYGAVVAVQAVRDGWGQTDRGWVSMDYLRPVEAAEEGLVTDTGLRVLQDILPAEADTAGRKQSGHLYHHPRDRQPLPGAPMLRHMRRTCEAAPPGMLR